MKRFLLLTLFLPLVLGACSESTTDDKGEPTPPPAVPGGTQTDPFGVGSVADASGKTAVWLEGFVVGADADETASAASRTIPQATSRSNVLLAAKADETDRAKCVRVDLQEGSDIQARLNIVDHPTLVGGKIKIQGDVTPGDSQGTFKIGNLTAQEGGQEPVENPDQPVPEEPEPPVTGDVELDKLYGYAEGTTGGTGATAANTHHFDDGKKFCAWLQLREKNKSTVPAIVWLSGTFTKTDGRDTASPWFDIKRTQNITICGTNDFTMEHVGFFLNEAKNIVIRNIYIKMPKADNGADGISMQESENVWVDHCTFESFNQTKDYEDGSCDITHASKNVTVSWCHFIKTQKSCLVGHSDGASADVAITATFHHNFFDLSSSRHPRVRYGRVHVYNNYFNQVSTYGVGSAFGAMVLVESNAFKGVTLPTDICTFPAKPSGSSFVSNLTGKVAGFLYERNNEFTEKPANARDPYPFVNVKYKAYNGEELATSYTFDDFKPAYTYIVDPTADVSTIVPSGAGTKKLTGYATAPIAVDNGGITTPTEPDPGPGPDPEEPEGANLGNGWTAISNGAANASASTSGNTLTLTSAGKFESGAQTFGFVYREITGDFVLTARVDSYTSGKTGNQSLAGLMLTPDAAAAGGDLIFAMTATDATPAYYYNGRDTAAGKVGKGALPALTPAEGVKPVLRLQRTGEKCAMSHSLDGGATFSKAKEITIAGLADKLFVGIAVNSGDAKATAKAEISNVTLNGTLVPFTEE